MNIRRALNENQPRYFALVIDSEEYEFQKWLRDLEDAQKAYIRNYKSLCARLAKARAAKSEERTRLKLERKRDRMAHARNVKKGLDDRSDNGLRAVLASTGNQITLDQLKAKLARAAKLRKVA